MYSVFIILSVCVALRCSNIIGLQIGCLLLSGEYPTHRERIREREGTYISRSSQLCTSVSIELFWGKQNATQALVFQGWVANMSLFQLFGIIGLLYWLYKWATSNHDEFEKRGLPYEKPLPLVGNNLGLILNKVSFHKLLADFYSRTRQQWVDSTKLKIRNREINRCLQYACGLL